MTRRHTIAVALVLAVFAGSASLLAVDGDEARYVGGTTTGVKEKAEGPLNTNNETALQFTAKKDGSIDILAHRSDAGAHRHRGDPGQLSSGGKPRWI